MLSRIRPIAIAVGLVALTFAYGCQTQDGFSPTEADRGLEASATAAEIFAMIKQVITDPTLGKSAKSQFENVVRTYPKNPADGIAKALSLIDFIEKHYLNGKWVDPGGVGTGELIAAIAAYVGLVPEAEAAVFCTPGVDCELFATENNEFAGTEIPGDQVTEPFVLYLIRLPDDAYDPPRFPLFFEIGTIPEGVEFTPTAASGSLTLSQFDDGPVAAVCALDEDDPLGVPADAVPGVNLFLSHFDGTNWEILPYVPVLPFPLDCEEASSGVAEALGLWSSPIRLTLGPALALLSPSSVQAKGTGLGGAISSFSDFGAEYVGPVATTTTVSILEGGPTFYDGDEITIQAIVTPAPANDQNPLAVFVVLPLSGGGSPTQPVVDGVAEHTFICGSAQVPFGSHTAGASFLGTSGYSLSLSGQVLSFDCLEGVASD